MAVGAAGPAEPSEDPEVDLRVSRPAVEMDLDAPLYTQDDAEAVLPLFRPSTTHRASRSRRASMPRSSTPATSSARRSSAFASQRR